MEPQTGQVSSSGLTRGMNSSKRDLDEVFILKSLINREFFLIIVIVYDTIKAGQPYCVGHRSCFGTAYGS